MSDKDKDKKSKNKIKFSEKKDGNKITYEVEKIKDEKPYTASDGKTKKTFKNVSGNDWFLAVAEWKSASEKEWKKKYEPKLGLWILMGALVLLIVGGIIAFMRSRNKKKSLDEEKFL